MLVISCSGGGSLNNPSGSNGDGSVEITDIPVITGSTPVSPATNSTPTVDGTSEPSAAIVVYSDSSCSTLAGTGTADGSGNFSISVSTTGGTLSTYYAQATAPGKSASACSTSNLAYQDTSIRPTLGWFSGTQSTAPATPTKLNQATAYAIEWSSSEFDSTYFTHSTSTNSHEITIATAGDYFLALTLPQEMISGTYRPCIRAEVQIDGTIVTGAVGESSYIRYDPTEGQNESSAHIAILLEGLSVGQKIEVFVQETAGENGSEVVNASGQASLFLEYVAATRTFFTGTATQTNAPSSATNINQATAYDLEWTSIRQDSGFTHNAGTPEDIVLDAAGDYLVFVNIPINSSVQRAAPRMLVELDGVQVDGGRAAQGYIRSDSGHNHASLQWSGLVTSSAASQVLSISTQLTANTGTAIIQAGNAAHITVEKIDTTSGVLSLKGTDLSGGTNWNPAAAQTILWDTSVVTNTTTFSHSTASNQDDITINEYGDYLLIYNDSLNSPSTSRTNPIIKVQVNSVDITGAETKTHYARQTSSHRESSGSLVFLLRNLVPTDVITVSAEQDVRTGTVNDQTHALLTLIKK